MNHYQKKFEENRAYEALVYLLRKEITQDFCCEDEKETFTASMKLLSEQSYRVSADWRDGVKDDWRVKMEIASRDH